MGVKRSGRTKAGAKRAGRYKSGVVKFKQTVMRSIVRRIHWVKKN